MATVMERLDATFKEVIMLIFIIFSLGTIYELKCKKRIREGSYIHWLYKYFDKFEYTKDATYDSDDEYY